MSQNLSKVQLCTCRVGAEYGMDDVSREIVLQTVTAVRLWLDFRLETNNR